MKSELFSVASLNFLGRLIPFLSMPLLQRFVYSPEDFGKYGFFFTIASISGTVYSLNYDVATSLMWREGHLKRISLALSLVIMFFLLITPVSLFLVIVTGFFKDILLYVVTGMLCGLIMALYDFFSVVVASSGNPVLTGKSTLLTSILNEIIRWTGIIFPLSVRHWLIITGRVISFATGVLWLIKDTAKKIKIQIILDLKILISFFRNYLDIQKYLWTSSFMATASMQMPVIFYTYTQKIEMAGYITASSSYVLGVIYFLAKGAQQVVYSRLASGSFSIRKIIKKYWFPFFVVYGVCLCGMWLLPDKGVEATLGKHWVNIRSPLIITFFFGAIMGIYWTFYPAILFYNLMNFLFKCELMRLTAIIALMFICSYAGIFDFFYHLFGLLQFIYFTLILIKIMMSET